jgi:hypothetical protein
LQRTESALHFKVYHNTLCTKYNYTLTRFYVIILSVLHLAKRSGGCSSETTRARTLALQSGAGWGQRRPRIASARPAASESRRSAPDCPAHQLDPKVQYNFCHPDSSLLNTAVFCTTAGYLDLIQPYFVQLYRKSSSANTKVAARRRSSLTCGRVVYVVAPGGLSSVGQRGPRRLTARRWETSALVPRPLKKMSPGPLRLRLRLRHRPRHRLRHRLRLRHLRQTTTNLLL